MSGLRETFDTICPLLTMAAGPDPDGFQYCEGSACAFWRRFAHSPAAGSCAYGGQVMVDSVAANKVTGGADEE